MKFKANPGTVVQGVGESGDLLGPFTADAKGVIEVPDDFQEAVTCLMGARGVELVVPEEPKPKKER